MTKHEYRFRVYWFAVYNHFMVERSDFLSSFECLSPIRPVRRLLPILLSGLLAGSSLAASLAYTPAPIDNPLKGLVPYAGEKRHLFPHSMEFNYFPLNKLMNEMDSFTWDPLEQFLSEVNGRGHQAVFRVFLEYPGKPNAVPDFLMQQGVPVTEWTTDNTYRGKSYTPDYNHPKLRQALVNFVRALGERYDGDPRIGSITAGLLGSWGEWHTYPRQDLWASKEVKAEVLDAYEQAFKVTPILVRYPAGDDDYDKASNVKRPIGYHDDSFAYATLDTGEKQHNWYFMAKMERAGATEKWKQHPIGGEIRPEVWGKVFDGPGNVPEGQAFDDCVQATHVTWLMDTGMFREMASPQRKARALAQVQKMGYEFYVTRGLLRQQDGEVSVTVEIGNTGVAPFYYDWPVYIGLLDEQGKATHEEKTDWSLTGLLPGETVRLVHRLPARDEASQVAIRVPNPMQGGIPLRFANQEQRLDEDAWMLLGRPEAQQPKLHQGRQR